MLLRIVALSTLVLVVLAAACFGLDRTQGLEPGSVVGVATFGDEGRQDVVARLANAVLFKKSDRDGVFSFDGLPIGNHGVRLIEDDNDDGIADRGAVVSFNLPETPSGAPAAVLLG